MVAKDVVATKSSTQATDRFGHPREEFWVVQQVTCKDNEVVFSLKRGIDHGLVVRQIRDAREVKIG